MSLAATVSASAARAIKAFGAKAVLTHTAQGAYDPSTGGTGSPTTTATNCSVTLDVVSKRVPGLKFGSSDLVQEGDLFATLASKGLPADPALGDTLTFNGWPWVIKAIWPTFVGGSAVLFECQVRR